MYLHGLVLLLSVFYSAVFVVGKTALHYSPPIFLTGARMLLAGLILLIFQLYHNPQAFKLKKEHIGPIVLVALMGVYLTNVLEFWGLQFMPSAKACFLYGFCPIATAFLSYKCFKERISLFQGMGLILGLLGFLPLLLDVDQPQNLMGFSLPEVAILSAAFCTAVGWLAMREGVKHRGLCPIVANSLSMIAGGTLSLLHSYCVEPWNPLPVADLYGFIPWLLLISLISNIICYNLHANLLKHFSATYLAFTGLSQPFFAAFLGWFFLNEVLSRYFWVSLFIVTFGLYLYYKEALKQKS